MISAGCLHQAFYFLCHGPKEGNHGTMSPSNTLVFTTASFTAILP